MRTRSWTTSLAIAALLLSGCGYSKGASAAEAKPEAAQSAGKKKRAIQVWAEAEPDDGEAPLTVELNADPLNQVDNPTYVWEFGDGSPHQKGRKVTHTYTKPGNYIAQVIVTDTDGRTATDSTPITVDTKD